MSTPRPPDPLFAQCPDRRHTGAEKWDRWPEDVIPVWVADMDFQAPPEVLEAIQARVNHGVFGYTADPPGFAPALAHHLEALHGWRIDPATVVGTPGVVTGLALSARLLTEPGDEILTFAPVYPPFLTLPGAAGRTSTRVALVRDASASSGWSIDFDALQAAVTPRTKLLWLCHPHNPTGTIFARADLLALADFAARNAIRVVSDEIWADLILDDVPHVPFATLDHPAAASCITLVAPSKTWNLAGLGCAAAIIPEESERKRWRPSGGGLVPMVNPLGYAAAEAAWLHGDPWRRRLVALLCDHRDRTLAAVAAIPGLEATRPQATYLVWVDCRKTGNPDPFAACVAAGVGPSDGRDFAAPGFIRLNTACPTDRLERALDRLRRAF
ncbi:MAG: PatB family C-S lyase [Planctomycetia bacterium]